MLSFFQNEGSASLKGVEGKKYRSKQQIIHYLLVYGEGTCNKIAKQIRLSSPSVQASLNEMVQSDLVVDKGQGMSTGGRRPTTYGLKKNSFYLMSIDIRRYLVRMVILDSHMKRVGEMEDMELEFHDHQEYLDQVVKLAEDKIGKTGIQKDRIIGIGFSMPGLIDSVEGINYSYFYQKDAPLTTRLAEKFGVPVFLENDANILALAEMWYGDARHRSNAIVLLVGWGIGMGMILNGELYGGASGFSGELGHVPAVDNGHLCWCKKQGCLETVASASALYPLMKEGLSKGRSSSLFASFDISKDHIDPKVVIEAAKQGDQFAVETLTRIGAELGKGISTMIQILNPEVIILGGRMASAGQLLTTPIHQSLNSYCNPLLTRELKIIPSKMGLDASMLGTAILVADRILLPTIHRS